MKEWGDPLFCLSWQKNSACGTGGRERKQDMAEKKASTTDKVWRIAAPIAEKLGRSLWDVRFVKEGADWFLRIFIDKEGGVSIDDCEAMSRALDAPLDEQDPIPQSYCLEVSSPGLERELTRPQHFEQMEGQPVKVTLIRPQNGQKILAGTLEGYRDGVILLGLNHGETIEIHKKETASVNLDDFDVGGGTEA